MLAKYPATMYPAEGPHSGTCHPPQSFLTPHRIASAGAGVCENSLRHLGPPSIVGTQCRGHQGSRAEESKSAVQQ
jgi:hypothetical protein